MMSNDESGSLRAYAKHRGVSPACVSKAVQRGRLQESVAVNAAGRPRIISFAKADAEWECNRTRPAPAQDADEPLSIPLEDLSVFVMNELVCIAVGDDLDDGYVLALEADTARVLGQRLVQVTGARSMPTFTEDELQSQR